MMLDETETMRTKLIELETEHRDLDSAIAAMAGSVATDQLQLQRLKKRKLAIKDQMSKLRAHLIPDIIA